MAVRLDIKSLLVVGLLLGACGDDGSEDSSNQQEEGRSDAGKPSGGDAGRRDAGNSGSGRDAAQDDDNDDGDDNDDDGEETSAEPDAGATKNDAGNTGGKADAGSDAGKSDAGTGGAVNCADLTYAKFGKAFMTANCVSCHDGGDHDFSTLAGVKASKAEIIVQAVESKQMPPGPNGPTDAERAKLGQWLNCGPN